MHAMANDPKLFYFVANVFLLVVSLGFLVFLYAVRSSMKPTLFKSQWLLVLGMALSCAGQIANDRWPVVSWISMAGTGVVLIAAFYYLRQHYRERSRS